MTDIGLQIPNDILNELPTDEINNYTGIASTVLSQSPTEDAIGVLIDVFPSFDLRAGGDVIVGAAYSSRGSAYGVYNNTMLNGEGESTGSDLPEGTTFNDYISGTSFTVDGFTSIGIYNVRGNSVAIDLGRGGDVMRGEAFGGTTAIGIANYTSIFGGDGEDGIYGTASNAFQSSTGILNGNSALIALGGENDTMSGTANLGGNQTYGIQNLGEASIFGGDGSDRVLGVADGVGFGIVGAAGIYNLGTINLASDVEGSENDDDYLLGAASGNAYGIVNAGEISTGIGNDTVIGRGADVFRGFLGGAENGKIQLGDGDDFIQGFGGQDVNGGLDNDVAKFEFGKSDLDGFENLNDSIFGLNLVLLTKGGVTMRLANFEELRFADVTIQLG